MGKVTGFKEYTREVPARRLVEARESTITSNGISRSPSEKCVQVQAALGITGGIPFCHTGCSVTNIIPDLNDLRITITEVSDQCPAFHQPLSPEFTGRICPAWRKPLACFKSTSSWSRSR